MVEEKVEGSDDGVTAQRPLLDGIVSESVFRTVCRVACHIMQGLS